MAIIRNCTSCPTKSVLGLDRQLIAIFEQLRPGLLARIDDLNVSLGESVHPYLQSGAKGALAQAIAARGQKLEINSAWRTIAGQCLLYQHYQRRRCGIGLASYPGRSNHQSAAAIDINDAPGWRPYLERQGWRWLGIKDPVHFDYPQAVDIREVSIHAFQKLWNLAFKSPSLVEDGIMGPKTFNALSNSPCEGFELPGIYNLPRRILTLTEPQQTGRDVRFIQMILEVNEATFGQQTLAAVKKFQQKKNLVTDGIVGDKTWTALEKFDIGTSHSIIDRN